MRRRTTGVVGQWVVPEKVARAREMRQEPTPAEAVLWKALRGRTLAGLRFRRQQPLAGFIVDFYCASRKLVIEVDGEIHDSQVEQDRERDAILSAAGLTLLRVANREVLHDLPNVLRRILRTIWPAGRGDPRQCE